MRAGHVGRFLHAVR